MVLQTTYALVALTLASVVISHPIAGVEEDAPKTVRKRTEIIERQLSTDDRYANWPSYDNLITGLSPDYPLRAAWGVWGSNDTLGALNHITKKSTQFAATEIQLGRTFNLNLPLDLFPTAIFTSRGNLKHEFRVNSGSLDDVIVLNTQINTQYDGLRHFPYSKNASIATYRWYNDLIGELDDIMLIDTPTTLGIQGVADKAIATRGVLLDFARWAEATGVEYDPFTTVPITAADLDAVAAFQGLEGDWSQPGDILLIRTGWVTKFLALPNLERELLPREWSASGGVRSIGLEPSDDVLRWIWDRKFSVVGGDNPAVETQPLDTWVPGGNDGFPLSLHQVFIGGWGQSLLEFVSLDALGEALAETGRSTFFVSVQTLNVEGGIASPPNAMAII